MPARGIYSQKYSAYNKSKDSFIAFGATPETRLWEHGTLTTDGVAGAQPNPLKYEKFANKGPHEQPHLSKVFQEAGMQPKQFSPKNPRNVPNFKLDISDIEGTKPAAKDWHNFAPRDTNPLNPQYKLPSAKKEDLPMPKFVRDPLDISDIAGSKAKSDCRPTRGLRSLDVTDIPGAKAAVPVHLRGGTNTRNSLNVSDIAVNDLSPQEKHQQFLEKLQQQNCTPRANAAWLGSPTTGRATSAPAAPYDRMSDVGVARSAGWRTRQYQAIREQGDILSAARAEADTTLERHAPHIASTSALSALLKGFRACDKDRSGRLQANEFSAVLRHAGLGLSQQEVYKLVNGLRDTNDLVEYKSFMGKLFTRAQQHKQRQRQQSTAGAFSLPLKPLQPDQTFGTHQAEPHRTRDTPRELGDGVGTDAPTAADEIKLPNWAAARQRRLSTTVALTLNQQPSATAREAASVVVPQPWHYNPPRRLSMVRPDPSAVDRHSTWHPPELGDLDEEVHALLEQAGHGQAGRRNGRSMSVTFMLRPEAQRRPTLSRPPLCPAGLPSAIPERGGGPERSGASSNGHSLRKMAHTPGSARRGTSSSRAHTPGSPLSRLGTAAGGPTVFREGAGSNAPNDSPRASRKGIATPNVGLAHRGASCETPSAPRRGATALRGGTSGDPPCTLPLLLVPPSPTPMRRPDPAPT